MFTFVPKCFIYKTKKWLDVVFFTLKNTENQKNIELNINMFQFSSSNRELRKKNTKPPKFVRTKYQKKFSLFPIFIKFLNNVLWFVKITR